MITFSANIRSASATTDDAITTSSVGIPVTLDLSADFDGLAKTLCFKTPSAAVDIALVGDATESTVPPDVLINSGEWLHIGIYAADANGDIVIPTVWANAGVIQLGALPSGVDPSEPTPSWVAQVQQIASDALETANSVRADADAGEFDGDPGPQGPEGPQGPKGEPGEVTQEEFDALTEDVTDLKSAVDEVYDVALGAYQSTSVSGAAVRFSGAADGLPLKSAVATIDYDANGKTGAKIVVGGKNLVAGYYPYSLASATVGGVVGVYLGRANGTGVGTTVYFPCKAGVTYTRSYTDEDTHNRTFWAAFDHLPVVKDFSSVIQSGGDQYTPPIDGYVCLFIKNALDENLYKYQQIEVGSIATEFEAAQTIQTINVDWSDVATVYGGTVDVASGTVISTLAADGTPLAEPVVYHIDRTDIYPKAGETTMWADCGNISVEYCLANADPDNSLRGKNILIFGDSITETNSLTIVNDKTTAYAWKNPSNSYVDGDGNTIKFSMWPKILMLNQRCGEIRNYALSGASYISATRTAGNERQNVQYQITVALNDRDNPNGVFSVDDFVPDIVIFALGTNDTINDTYSDAMAKTVLEADESTIDVDATIANLDETKFCESVRKAYLRIKQAFPTAQMYCVVPIQRASAEPATAKRENLMQMAGRYGLVIIDGTNESGITREFNTSSGLGVYLKDGLHPNEIGQNLMARMIISALKSHYITFGAGFNTQQTA